MSHRKHVDHFLNCGAQTPGAYCAACGQEATDASVTFHDQLSDFFSEVVSVEARLVQTVSGLFLRPGALSYAYNTGQRVRFVTPLKTYLFASVVFFLVLSVTASRSDKQFTARPLGIGGGLSVTYESSPSPAPQGGASADEGEKVDDAAQFRDEASFDRWCKRPGHEKECPAWLEPHLRSLVKSPQGFLAAVIDMISRASMVLVPVHALILKLLYRKPRRLYGEHIVFSLHVHSFVYLLFTFGTLVGLLLSPGTAGARNAALSNQPARPA